VNRSTQAAISIVAVAKPVMNICIGGTLQSGGKSLPVARRETSWMARPRPRPARNITDRDMLIAY
jgi:hypothetical protein